jgi:tetratricopeptide (TPR) repeat protein
VISHVVSKELSTSEISDLKKKLETDPGSIAFVPLAEAYRKEGLLDDAYRVCRKGLEKNPNYSNGHLVLGRIYHGQSKLDDAVIEFNKVLGLDPENLMAHALLGALYMQKTDYQSAIDEYQCILTLNPDDDETPKLLKAAIEMAANISHAAPTNEDKKTIIKKESNSGSVASVTMAELYLKQGHIDKAIDTYEELLKKDPNYALARQKLVDLKNKAAVDSFGDTFNKGETTLDNDIKAGKSKPSYSFNKEKESKFSEDDMLQVLSLNRSDKEVKSLGKSNSIEVKNSDVTKENKEPEKVKILNKSLGDSASIQYSATQIEAFKAVMAELLSITGICQCFLTSLEGISVVSVGENGNNNSSEKQVLSIFTDTSQFVSKLKQGLLKQVLVTAETGYILLVAFAGGVLVVLADRQINLGMLRLVMDEAAKKVEKVS